MFYPHYYHRYGEALTTLSQLIVSKVRYHSNGAMLEEVDDTLTDSETKEICHTEWDLFLGKLTQLLSKVGHVINLSDSLVGALL